MDRKPQNRPPLDNSDLAKLPRNTMAKSMKPLEDIMIRHIGRGDLTADEERLLDRVIFERTGQHIGKFKDQTPKPKKPSYSPKVKLNKSPDSAYTDEPVPVRPDHVS